MAVKAAAAAAASAPRIETLKVSNAILAISHVILPQQIWLSGARSINIYIQHVQTALEKKSGNKFADHELLLVECN
jgi:hypothetical protein